jgi:alginate O-acetyltransferase complex protein AlgI
VCLNLASIGYFKYANFFVDNINTVTSTDFNLTTIILPLAISFFTFQQITFLIDSYRGSTNKQGFLNYCLFVSFFPQLIAGPIVHHSEMLPQFARPDIFRFKPGNLAIGLTIFALGLFKKAVLADGIAGYANPVFMAADAGQTFTFFEAWAGALAYTFQLYFDFSGYSDMALGAARMFGIRLPVNFHSPYKAINIIDFWRRWHITLSRFLRDYIYIELGGNRKGPTRRHFNLMATMLIGGLWHGAGWTFVAWGALHGFYLVVNHGWQLMRRTLNGGIPPESTWLGRLSSRSLTFFAVVVGWVFFRALTFEGALNMLQAMAGLNGVTLPEAIALRTATIAELLSTLGVQFTPGGGAVFLGAWSWIVVLAAIAFFAPNSLDLMRRYRPALHYRFGGERPAGMSWLYKPVDAFAALRWRPSIAWACFTSVLTAGGVLALPQVSDFLYFQF